jgi:hypothetical protein
MKKNQKICLKNPRNDSGNLVLVYYFECWFFISPKNLLGYSFLSTRRKKSPAFKTSEFGIGIWTRIGSKSER